MEQNQEISFDQIRHEMSVRYNELVRVMNSHQERCIDGSSRVELDCAEAQQLLQDLRSSMVKLMAMECKEQGVRSNRIMLSRMIIVSSVNQLELCRA